MNKPEKIIYSIIIPVFNSEKSLNELFDRIEKVFFQLSKSFEVIFINDNSIDDSLTILHNIYKKNKNVTIIDLHSNNGQQNALMCGFHYCNGEMIITLDDDLQNPPEEIPKLINKISEGYDMVIGTYEKKQDTFKKKLGSLIFRKLNHYIFKVTNDLKFSSFRIMKRNLIEEIKSTKTIYPYITGIALNITRNIANIKVKHHSRKHGKSNYSISRLLNVSFDLLINYSAIPLKIIGLFGLFASFISLSVGLFFMIKQILLNQAPPGWTSVIVLISFFNSILLIMFFTIGIYISRMLRELSSNYSFPIKKVLL